MVMPYLKEMLDAIINGDLSNIRRIAAEGIELNRRYDGNEEKVLIHGDTFLSHAIAYGDPRVVECLLELGADYHSDELYFLRDACVHSEVLKLFIRRGTDVRKKYDGHSLITYFCQRWGGCDDEYLDGLIESLDILVKEGVNINYRETSNGQTALQYAIDYHNEKLADVLVNRFEAAGDLIALHYGRSPLHEALFKEELAIAEIIIKSRISLNVLSSSDYMTPLHIAVLPTYQRKNRKKMLKIVRLLLERGATPDLPDGENMTALGHVAFHSYRNRSNAMPLINALIEHGADPRTKVGWDPCEPLVVKVLRNEKNHVIPEVLAFFRQFE
jgi:ankyrin repeat protein